MAPLAKDELSFRARASWYAALVAHNGQSVDVFAEACTKTPPAMPRVRQGRKSTRLTQLVCRMGVAAVMRDISKPSSVTLSRCGVGDALTGHSDRDLHARFER